MLKVANSVISASRITGVLPVANGGTNASTASITSFNNITGFTASGTTGTTSTNLVFATTPTLVGDVTLSTGNLVIGTSGKGIDFTATSSGSGTMTSELLADYEEGTFTPVWTPASGSGQTVPTAVGVYTKVGNRCFFDITLSTNGHGTASGTVTIAGLPFTATSAANITGAAFVSQASNAGITAGYAATAVISYNSTVLNPLLWDATTGTTVLQVSEWGVSGAWRFCGSYQTA